MRLLCIAAQVFDNRDPNRFTPLLLRFTPFLTYVYTLSFLRLHPCPSLGYSHNFSARPNPVDLGNLAYINTEHLIFAFFLQLFNLLHYLHYLLRIIRMSDYVASNDYCKLDALHNRIKAYAKLTGFNDDDSAYKDDSADENNPEYKDNSAHVDDSANENDPVYKDDSAYVDNSADENNPVYKDDPIYEDDPAHKDNSVYEDNPVHKNDAVKEDDSAVEDDQN